LTGLHGFFLSQLPEEAEKVQSTSGEGFSLAFRFSSGKAKIIIL